MKAHGGVDEARGPVERDLDRVKGYTEGTLKVIGKVESRLIDLDSAPRQADEGAPDEDISQR